MMWSDKQRCPMRRKLSGGCPGCRRCGYVVMQTCCHFAISVCVCVVRHATQKTRDSGTDSDSGADSGVDSGTDPDSGADTGINFGANSGVDFGTDSDSGINSGADSDFGVDLESETDS